MDTIDTRLWNYFEQKGFFKEGIMSRYNSKDENYCGAADEFFLKLVNSKEIDAYRYTESDVYDDVVGSYGCVSFAWFSHGNLDMIAFNTED